MNEIFGDRDLNYINMDLFRARRKEKFKILGWVIYDDISDRDKKNWKGSGLKE